MLETTARRIKQKLVISKPARIDRYCKDCKNANNVVAENLVWLCKICQYKNREDNVRINTSCPQCNKKIVVNVNEYLITLTNVVEKKNTKKR